MRGFGVQTPLGNWAREKTADGHWVTPFFEREQDADHFVVERNRFLQTPTYAVVPTTLPDPPARVVKTLTVKRKPATKVVFRLTRKRTR